MTEALKNINELIHTEADILLYERGLLPILKQFGAPHVTGSYALNLMTWRDLDIYLETNDMTEENFFKLGMTINKAFNPMKMSYRNERMSKTEGLPFGLYWGIYLGNERKGAWKIDLWAMDANECKQRLQFCDDIAARLTPSATEVIMAIKSACWQDAEYRRSYNSNDIYESVLSGRVNNIEQFREYLKYRRHGDS